MGAAEPGRELGDAGGPLLVLLVAGIAAATTLTGGFAALAALTAAAVLPLTHRTAPPKPKEPHGTGTRI